MKRPHGSRRSSKSRSFLQRTIGDPYQPAASQISNLPFTSRRLPKAAPLFYSATDEFREEDEEAEHEREIADFYALQKSRRQFGSSHLKDSSEVDVEDRTSTESDDSQTLHRGRFAKGKGIKSSWRGEEGSFRDQEDNSPAGRGSTEGDRLEDHSQTSSKPTGHLVDIGLDDTFERHGDDERSDTSELRDDDQPPSIQRFREREQFNNQGEGRGANSPFKYAGIDKQSYSYNPRRTSFTGSYLSSVTPAHAEPPLHDAFWGQLFLISLASLFATAFLVYLHTRAPGNKSTWGDTVYMTIHRSYFLLGVYTMVSIFISLLWLALLRFYVRPLVYVVFFSVPIILYSFSLYPFISSFKGAWHGTSIQDKAMRFGSAIPFIIASAWIYTVIRCRHVIGKAINILEFACRILAANPELLALGLGTLVCVASWTWLWMLMFTRVFLGGHLSESKSFIISVSSWWLGAYFVLTYVWSLGVLGGIQRAVTAATVSQWYFHRLATPTPTSGQIVQAAISHSLTTLFGTICFSRLLQLLIRLPLLLLPNRASSLFSLFVYSFVPTPITALTNSLSLSYAAIHSQPLSVSARGLAQLTILSPSATTTSLYPRAYHFSRHHGSHTPLLSYQLAKLILHAARFVMSLALSFGGWVSTARNLTIPGVGGSARGSLYAYIVGLIAGAIGWGILGAVEGIIADIVDASIICWSSEVGTYGGEARYCREAGWLFGEDIFDNRHTQPRADV